VTRNEGLDAPSAEAPVLSPGPVRNQEGYLLEVKGLKTHIFLKRGVVKAADGVSFTIRRGESVGLVGESGSGKTMTCLSILRLMSTPSARIVGGEVRFQGENLLTKSDAEMRHYRGRRIAMIMQDALAALNPVLTIGDQIAEPMQYHGIETSKPGRLARVIDMLKAVRIPRPDERLRDYPHQLSGGMRQRVVAAMGLGTSPDLIIADEPTTALDVTIQAQFLKLIRDLQKRNNMSVLWVTHDLGVVAQTCDRVNVMYAGRIVESGDVRRVLRHPQHPYTVGLMESVPALGVKGRRLHQIEGHPPDLLDMPAGCAFYARCPLRMDVCKQHYPPETPVGTDGFVRCWARMPAASLAASQKNPGRRPEAACQTGA
jgi:oligopeptide/dipeptide ABC transporter ATP-binding protein